MNVIFEYFNKIIPIGNEQIQELTPLLTIKTIEKDEFLLSENNPCNYLTFIKTGSFRVFHVKGNGNLAILSLNSENEFISDFESFVTGYASKTSIQAIEKSEIISISKEHLNCLLENSLYWNKVAYAMTTNIFLTSKLRLESMMYDTPTERYLDLITNYPEFLERYSLTDIANYIGVTIQSLSRIRSQVN